MSIGSIVEKIKEIRFSALDHKPRKTVAAVNIEGLILIKFEDGTIFCSGNKADKYYYLTRSHHWTDKMLKGLRVLGIINTKDIKDHLEECKKNDAYAVREDHRNDLERLSDKCGFKISEDQRKVLKFDERPV